MRFAEEENLVLIADEVQKILQTPTLLLTTSPVSGCLLSRRHITATCDVSEQSVYAS